MGFIGNIFSGRKGLGWEASGTNITAPTTAGQAQTAYDQTQQGLQQQQAFLQALQGQGGLANQSSVFGQQQNLANLMQGIAAGTGPNPALAQLNQATGQNIAATTAAMAGARGAGSNPALMARSAARAGADTQQQAVGQAATLQAQQQIAGMDALSRQQQAMGSMANTQVANQAAATNAYSTAAQNQQQNILAAINAQNQANVAMQSNKNQADVAMQGKVADAQGGLLNSLGKPFGLNFGATGGLVKKHQIGNNYSEYADGGEVERMAPPAIDTPWNMSTGPVEAGNLNTGKSKEKEKEGDGSPGGLFGGKEPVADLPGLLKSGLKAGASAALGVAAPGFSKGGKVPALVSPGEKYLTPGQAQDVLKGKENPLNGKTIPGKAKVKGDSYENDTVPVTLEEGGCVIPRSVLQSDQPMKNAIKFVHAHMKKMAKGGKVENEKKQEQTQEQVAPVSREVAQEVLRNPHFLFSVEHTNPDIKPEIRATREQALNHLREIGMVAEPAQGNYEGYKEPSIMVHNVTPEDVAYLYDFARRHGQESAIFSVGGKHEARYLNGPHKGKVVRGEGTEIHEKEPEDYYTKTENGLIFGHKIDWGTKYDK